jgi:prepilin-type N-terminal cleavage/methylation domain-containing protein
MRHSRSGFTLLEMLLVVVLVGVIGTMAIPQISRLTGRNSVGRAALVVRQDLQRAFALAARLRKPVTLTADNSSAIYQVTDASNNVLLVRRLSRSQEYGVETMTFAPTTLTIQPSGVASAAVIVTLTSGGSTRQVKMTAAGLIRRTQ